MLQDPSVTQVTSSSVEPVDQFNPFPAHPTVRRLASSPLIIVSPPASPPLHQFLPPGLCLLCRLLLFHVGGFLVSSTTPLLFSFPFSFTPFISYPTPHFLVVYLFISSCFFFPSGQPGGSHHSSLHLPARCVAAVHGAQSTGEAHFYWTLRTGDVRDSPPPFLNLLLTRKTLGCVLRRKAFLTTDVLFFFFLLQATAAAAQANLLKQQEELERKAAELDRREQELQTRGPSGDWRPGRSKHKRIPPRPFIHTI